MIAREQTLLKLADAIAALPAERPIRVAVDGRTASGKTTFANELATRLRRLNRPVIRAEIDGFHRPRAERYARGRFSPDGYFHDARDLPAIRTLLLEPLGPGGDRHYRTASLDLETDRKMEAEPVLAPANAILIVDGTFLQRAELRDCWDVAIYIDTSAETCRRRGLKRDMGRLGVQAERLYRERYGPAELIYRTGFDPAAAADALVNNNNLAEPKLKFKADGRLGGG